MKRYKSRNRNKSVEGLVSYIYNPDGTEEDLVTIWKAPFPWTDPVDIPVDQVEKPNKN